MREAFIRTQGLYGKKGLERLSNARVAVFGIGGVGGYVVEGLARSGIGALDLIDHDMVCLLNLNRQIIATNSTIGQYKVDVAKKRIMEINPDCRVRKYPLFYLQNTADVFDFSQYDYIVDAIDTVSAKLLLIEKAKMAGTKIISAMGAGNKVDPTGFCVADIYETSVCPLAKVMRRECRKRGIERLKVVYSKEIPHYYIDQDNEDALFCSEQTITSEQSKRVPGSAVFVVAVAGMMIAGEVVNDLIL